MFCKGPDTMDSIPSLAFGRGLGGINGVDSLPKQILDCLYVRQRKAGRLQRGRGRKKRRRWENNGIGELDLMYDLKFENNKEPLEDKKEEDNSIKRSQPQIKPQSEIKPPFQPDQAQASSKVMLQLEEGLNENSDSSGKQGNGYIHKNWLRDLKVSLFNFLHKMIPKN